MSKSKGMTREEVRQQSAERLTDMREAGIKFVSVLGSPNPGENCEACMAIMSTREKDGDKIEIEFAAPLPLPDCDREFCKCCYIAVE
jgi:hypothetical protein